MRLGPAEHEDVGDDVGAERVEVAGITGLSGGAGNGVDALHRGDDLVGVVDEVEHPEAVAVDLRVRAAAAPRPASSVGGLAVGRQAGAGQSLTEESRGGRRTVLGPKDGVDDVRAALDGQRRRSRLDRAGPVETHAAPR